MTDFTLEMLLGLVSGSVFALMLLYVVICNITGRGL